MMRIKATCYYYDKQLRKHIRDGDEYEVDDERGKELIDKKLAGEVEAAAKSDEKKAAAKTAKK